MRNSKSYQLCLNLLIVSLLFSSVITVSTIYGFSDTSSIDTGNEYSSGSLQLGQTMNVWYTWINSSGTQVAFFTYYSEVYNSPIMTFLGQHYVANETEVFIGNTLLLMEVYRDGDGDGVPQADFTADPGEIEYFLLVNSSMNFIPEPVQKNMIDSIPHYIWGIEYIGVDGFLLYPEDKTINGSKTNLAAEVNVTSLSFTYDFSIEGNTSLLKTGFKGGDISDLKAYTTNMSLEGLGLSLLYGSTMLTTKPYTVLVNDQPYVSTLSEAEITSTNRAEVIIDDRKLYEFIFEENYTLQRASALESYSAKSVASPLNSIPPNSAVYLSPDWLVGWLLRFLSEETFPRMRTSLPNIDLEYANSAFVYRMCYPQWEGYCLEHDPTYIAYLSPLEGGLPPLEGLPVEMIGIAIAGSLALIVALLELRRTRRILKVIPLAMQ